MKIAEMTSCDVKSTASKLTAVVPIAAVEQHGYHLPTGTDSMIVSELAKRVEGELSGSVMLLPTLWLGNSHHHYGFAGTLSVSSRVFTEVILDIIESLRLSGFQRIFFLNGHGGNAIPCTEALYQYSLKNKNIWVAAQSYWELAKQQLDADSCMETPCLSHACEYETSMILAINPELVILDLAQGDRAERRSEFYDPLSYKPSRVKVCEPFSDLSKSGALGSPELATAEKGKHLLEIITQSIVDFLNEFSHWKHSNTERKDALGLNHVSRV